MYRGMTTATPSGACVAQPEADDVPLFDRMLLMAHLDTFGARPKAFIADSDSCHGQGDEPQCRLATSWHQASDHFRQRLLPSFISQLNLLNNPVGDSSQQVKQACIALNDPLSPASDRLLVVSEWEYPDSVHVRKMLDEASGLLKQQCGINHQEL